MTKIFPSFSSAFSIFRYHNFLLFSLLNKKEKITSLAYLPNWIFRYRDNEPTWIERQFCGIITSLLSFQFGSHKTVVSGCFRGHSYWLFALKISIFWYYFCWRKSFTTHKEALLSFLGGHKNADHKEEYIFL